MADLLHGVAIGTGNNRRIELKDAVKMRRRVESGEVYLLDFPTKRAVYEVVKKSYCLEGTFLLLRKNGSYTQGRVKVLPVYVWFESGENNIVLRDVADREYFIHLQHDAGERYKPTSLPSGGYSSFPFYICKNSTADAVNMFATFYGCMGSDPVIVEEAVYNCRLRDMSTELMCFNYEKCICGRPDSSCSYKESMNIK